MLIQQLILCIFCTLNKYDKYPNTRLTLVWMITIYCSGWSVGTLIEVVSGQDRNYMGTCDQEILHVGVVPSKYTLHGTTSAHIINLRSGIYELYDPIANVAYIANSALMLFCYWNNQSGWTFLFFVFPDKSQAMLCIRSLVKKKRCSASPWCVATWKYK